MISRCAAIFPGARSVRGRQTSVDLGRHGLDAVATCNSCRFPTSFGPRGGRDLVANCEIPVRHSELTNRRMSR